MVILLLHLFKCFLGKQKGDFAASLCKFVSKLEEVAYQNEEVIQNKEVAYQNEEVIQNKDLHFQETTQKTSHHQSFLTRRIEETKMSQQPINPNLHILMFPWFSIHHITPYLNLANILAGKGYKITFLLPNKTQTQFQKSNHHPDSITLHSLTLPAGTENIEDIPIHKTHIFLTILDSTRDQVENIISEAKPDLVMHDVVNWISEITKPIGIKVLSYNVINTSVLIANYFLLERSGDDTSVTEEELLTKPPEEGYPYPTIALRPHEARKFLLQVKENRSFYERLSDSMKGCDLIGIRTCYPVDGILTDYLGSLYEKPVILTSPVLSEPVEPLIDDRLVKWMSRFDPGSVVFCSFGSDFNIDKRQFQELCLGIESTGFPFLVVVRSPNEEAFPEGFEERVKEYGLVWREPVRQKEILSNPSIGCFVSDCGFSSMWDFLVNGCQVVLVPNSVDQIFNTRLLADGLKFKLAFEVERDETGWFSKENLNKAINIVMDKESELGSTLKKNHEHLKDLFTSPGYFMNRYIDKFMRTVQDLIQP